MEKFLQYLFSGLYCDMFLEEIKKKTYVYYEKGMKYGNLFILGLVCNYSYIEYVKSGYFPWYYQILFLIAVALWLFDTEESVEINRITGKVKLFKITTTDDKEYFIACRDVDELAILVVDVLKNEIGENTDYDVEFVDYVIF
jgi:hypothetical protein